TRFSRDWSSDVCSSDLKGPFPPRTKIIGCRGCRVAPIVMSYVLIPFTYAQGRVWGKRHHSAPTRHPPSEPPQQISAFRTRNPLRSEERRVGKEQNARMS